MFNIVLLEPRIPQNTGTIGRLAFATNCRLHLIKPYGFEISEKALRRAGLDYWHELDVNEYENIEEFWEKNQGKRHFFATTKTTKLYFENEYRQDDYFWFGREDAGLPENLLQQHQNSCVTIPMTNSARSLNIANSVSIVVYEAIKQNIKEFQIL
ncbi:MAG: tRNA (cytidine(34)-2'-O)-methyltransferase [Campylobacterales bacterium]|nr:tRNA (cytidine(34)-2'-O)-methyltransferase [Campylobacterales bacterium]